MYLYLIKTSAHYVLVARYQKWFAEFEDWKIEFGKNNRNTKRILQIKHIVKPFWETHAKSCYV